VKKCRIHEVLTLRNNVVKYGWWRFCRNYLSIDPILTLKAIDAMNLLPQTNNTREISPQQEQFLSNLFDNGGNVTDAALSCRVR